MSSMSTIRRIPPIASILVVVCYLAFTALAFIKYPLPYSLADNWLSDLGNITRSPGGAQIYNLGMIVTGLLVLIFFLTIYIWKLQSNRIQNAMLLLTQVFGILASFSMIMTAIYPINFPAPHSFWSAALDIALGTSFAFSVAALRYYQKTPRWLLAMGILTVLVDFVFSVFFNGVHILEWLTIGLFLAYIFALGAFTRRISSPIP
jgi:hypothetical membrane protein